MPNVVVRNRIELPPNAENWVASYRAANAEIKKWEEVRQAARERLEEMMGDAEEGVYERKVIVHFVKVESWRLDQKAVKEKFPH